MKVVIEANDKYKSMLQEIATAIKAKITFEENQIDFWDELPSNEKKGILESKNQIKLGDFKSHDQVMNDYKVRFK